MSAIEMHLYDIVRQAVRDEMESLPDTKCLTYEQVGRELGGLSKRQVENLVANGWIKAVRASRQRPLIRVRDLEHFLETGWTEERAQQLEEEQ